MAVPYSILFSARVAVCPESTESRLRVGRFDASTARVGYLKYVLAMVRYV